MCIWSCTIFLIYTRSLLHYFSTVYVTKADMCSSLKAIKDSLDADPEVESLRCSTDTKCRSLKCKFNLFINTTIPSQMKITLKPCAATPAVSVKMWIQGTRVLSKKFKQRTVTTFSHLGITTRMAVTVTQEIYGVIFGVSLLHVTQHLGVLSVVL